MENIATFGCSVCLLVIISDVDVVSIQFGVVIFAHYICCIWNHPLLSVSLFSLHYAKSQVTRDVSCVLKKTIPKTIHSIWFRFIFFDFVDCSVVCIPPPASCCTLYCEWFSTHTCTADSPKLDDMNPSRSFKWFVISYEFEWNMNFHRWIVDANSYRSKWARLLYLPQTS